MKWSLNQAAKEGGKSKATILRAINSGRMSAPKNELGEYEIDPAEFFRVFPPESAVPGSAPGTETDADHHILPGDTSPLAAELKFLREKLQLVEAMGDKEIALLNARIEELREDRDDLRNERDSLLKTLQEQALSVRLLTSQPEQPAPPTAPPPSSEPRRSLWSTLFRKAG